MAALMQTTVTKMAQTRSIPMVRMRSLRSVACSKASDEIRGRVMGSCGAGAGAKYPGRRPRRKFYENRVKNHPYGRNKRYRHSTCLRKGPIEGAEGSFDGP